MKTLLFYQCTVTDDNVSAVEAQLASLQRSGLSDACDRFYVGFTGDQDAVARALPLFARLKSFDSLFSSEIDCTGVRTLESMHWVSTRTQFYALYLHTGPVLCPAASCRAGRHRNCVGYFCIDKWRECIQALDEGYDCVGVSFEAHPFRRFAGNHWWARSSYLRTLQPPHTFARGGFAHGAEQYVGSGHGMRVKSFLSCPRDVHRRPLAFQCEVEHGDSEPAAIMAAGSLPPPTAGMSC